MVDDEQEIVRTLTRGLQSHGLAVDAFDNPLEALGQYRPNFYSHHLLDIRMPGMNGFELARRIWQQDPNARVCFLSSFEIFEDEALKVFKGLNTKCFVKKPISPAALLRHLRAHVTLLI